MVSVAIGVMLAIGLSATEQSFGFNLGSLGPFAAGIFFCVVGVAVFLGIKSTGIDKIGSLALAFVVTYVAVWTVISDVADLIMHSRYSSMVHVVLLIAILISLYKFFRLLLPGRNTLWNVNALQQKNPPSKYPKDLLDRFHTEKREVDLIKNRLERITQATEKTSRQILDGMVELKRLIKEQGGTAQGTDRVVKKLEEIAPKQQQVSKALMYLKEIVRKLSSFDYRNFKKLRDEYQNLSNNARKRIKQKLVDEWKKLGAEEKLKKIEERVIAYNRNFSSAVKKVIDALRKNRLNDAVSWVEKAIGYERSVDRMLQYIKKLEEKLEKYTMQEIKHDTKTLKNPNKQP